MKNEVTLSEASSHQAIEGPKRAAAEAHAESARLLECRRSSVPWKKWGPYLS